jgi:hypothetical protein
MPWLDYLAYFGGGMFAANAVPHFVQGISGKPFQSPFARPRGAGQSSSVVNMIWALVNLVIVWLLLAKVGSFDLHDLGDTLSFGLGVGFIGLFLAYHFGRHNGGNAPRSA